MKHKGEKLEISMQLPLSFGNLENEFHRKVKKDSILNNTGAVSMRNMKTLTDSKTLTCGLYILFSFLIYTLYVRRIGCRIFQNVYIIWVNL